MTSAIIDSTTAQVFDAVAQESITAADLAEGRRLLTLVRRAEAARDRYHKKKIAKATAGFVGPQDHLTSLPTTTPDLANELRLRHNARNRKSYAASVAVKRASSAQEDAGRVTAETAADWRRLRRAETARDRYQKRVHPFGVESESDDPVVRAEERRVHSN